MSEEFLPPTRTRLITHILGFNYGEDYWYGHLSGLVKDGLLSIHMGWSFTSAETDDADTALEHIKERPDLEVVTFANLTGRPIQDVVSDAVLIADALMKHPTQPWAHLDCTALDLQSILESFGVHVETDQLEVVIANRWMHRVQMLDCTSAAA
jgi:hypothetical protein